MKAQLARPRLSRVKYLGGVEKKTHRGKNPFLMKLIPQNFVSTLVDDVWLLIS